MESNQEELHPDAPLRRALVIANPIAGRGHGEQVAREVTAGLEGRGVHAELFLTSGPGDGRARVRCMEPDTDLVVSVGGDGTLREVFDGLTDERVPVGVLPMGTANVLSLDLKLPRDVDRALEIMCGGKTATLDMASVNGHLSFLVTGVGLDGMVVRELEAARDGPITKWSYVSATLRALRDYEPPELTVEIDGELLEGTFGLCLIGNIIHYGGVMKLSPERQLDDGRFEVYLFERATLPKLASAAARGLVSDLRKACRLETARTVRVTAASPVAFQVDGDYRGETPVEFEVTGRRFRVLVP